MRLKPRDALLIVDVINDLAFPGGEDLLPWGLRAAPRIVSARAKARAADVPVIYANDNYGHWRSTFGDVYAHCTRRGARGREISRKLKPAATDYFILKPRHSAFYATSLVPLLESLRTRRLILAGFATNLCVLFTAHDAHMRGYDLVALSDCCAAESDFDHDTALGQLKRFCGASICRSDELEPMRQARKHRSRTPRP